MKRAGIGDKNLIVDILCESFRNNLSVNYILNQSGDKTKRLKNLMDYSFEVCHAFGEVFLSDDHKACALVLYPDQKRTTLKSIFLDVKLIVGTLGIRNIFKAMSREKVIKSNYPNQPFYYLWFIGVSVPDQHKGIGSKLLEELMEDANQKGRSVYLETSTEKNLSWYKKFGFSNYNKLDFGYTLFLFKKH
ncbi:GNAT family N-acetyltransferase [Pedobacter caeni]|uniref:Acetyltransferase (GNAT) family protein n=1 Tax=Pedobacter caeni TaxID=288992 RepID=A0A1M5P8W6_9SPHI|nr:GNAT family N-acetyltransferase [Pedobacter caeni]SHG97663.1 Acetyltransferase (GNAT) family protein [Pedobacter caeni]